MKILIKNKFTLIHSLGHSQTNQLCIEINKVEEEKEKRTIKNGKQLKAISTERTENDPCFQ